MKVARVGNDTFPQMAARLGWTLEQDLTTDVPDPVDLGLTADAFVKRPAPTTVTLVNSATFTGNFSASGSSHAIGFSTTAGNLLVCLIARRDHQDVAVTGWTLIVENDHTAYPTMPDALAIYAKVSDGTETTIAFTSAVGSGQTTYATIYELNGPTLASALVAGAASRLNSSGTTLSTTGVTPPSGSAGVVFGLFAQKQDGATTLAEGSGWTADYNPGGSAHPHYLTEHQVVASASGSYAPDATSTRSDAWWGLAAAFSLAGDEYFVTAPEITDGDDATYATCALDGDVVEWNMADFVPMRLASATLKIGLEFAGSETLELEGATVPDFLDAVVLDSVTFAATGSYTPDTVAFTLPGTSAYAFYRIVTTSGAANRRFFTLSLYAPVSDLSAYQLRSEKDVASGYAGLDGSGLVPVAELPKVEDLASAETDATLVLAPDGAGGVEFRAETGGGGGGTFGTPAVVLGTVAAAGSIDEVIRRDSTIVAFDASAPVTQAFSDVAATGSATVAARRDHVHGMPANPGSGSGVTIFTDVIQSPATFSGTTSCVVTLVSPSSSNFFYALIASTTRGANSITQTNVTWTKLVTSNGNSQFAEVWRGAPSGTPGTTATVAFTGSANQQCTVIESTHNWSTATNVATATGTGQSFLLATTGFSASDTVIAIIASAGPTFGLMICNVPFYSITANGGQEKIAIIVAPGGQVTIHGQNNTGVSWQIAAYKMT